MQHARSFRNPRHRDGFSIIELMVTVSLAAVLFAIAIPSFRQIIATNNLATQTNDFIGALNFARSEAITRNVTITFCRVDAPADDDCGGGSDVWQNWIVRTGTGTVVRRGEVTDAGGISVVSTLIDDTIVFGSDGLSTTGGVLVSGSQFNVCSDMASGENIRQVTLGGGSRISTVKLAGTC